ncbi:hypothetical protein, conserved [Babesia ovata]|uniref:C3H1-type domain-containing protein n=1 Tax=Babesia ovata TaxID=189622 RepID=A0A2H6K8Y1_9APIC|nr:uncharacterized protein BOVATA_009480 [Babesia ovata]GBE59455.1 hypothetical protein, conserved [Babesia ovata]
MVRQPKKLTDCPENLRESIDWLIQVRHGGDRKGLQKLAEALKKFITEAIDDATSSLEQRKQQLECPEKYYSDRESSYCQTQQVDIQKLEDEIAGNSVTEFEKSKKKSNLDKLKKEKDDHYNEVHYLTDDARNKALGDIEERKSELKDLQSKLEALVGSKYSNINPAAKLLENLTDGLEKFLGFNSDSKGYDGKGIVYSDLDRLCDAVMAFLHGVLDSVKSEDVVVNYDNHIKKIHVNDQLSRVLGSLKASVGRGSGEFGTRVGNVAEWLRRYDDGVKEKNKEVTRQLDEFRNKEIGDKMTDINIAQHKSLRAIHKAYVQAITALGESITELKSNENGFAALDKDLKSKLTVPVEKIDQGIMMLKTSSENKMLADQANKLDEAVEEQKKTILHKLHMQFLDVSAKMSNLNGVKRYHFENINDKLKDFGVFIDNNFDRDYKEQIAWTFEEFKFAVTNACDTLNAHKNALKALVTEAQRQFDIIKIGVKAGFIRQGNVDLSIEDNWKKLCSKLETIVGDVTKKGQKKPDSLADIVEEVHKYAKRYGEDFESTVANWVENIVRGEAVKGLFEKYVSNNHGRTLFQGSLQDQGNGDILQELAPIVQKKIQIALGGITVDKKPGIKTGVDENLSEIVQYLRGYAKDVAGKHTQIVEDIEIALKGDPKFSLQQNDTFRSDLQAAVKATLGAIKSAVEGAAEEIENFRTKSQIKKLTKAIASVSSISTEINTGLVTGSLGGRIDTSLQGVKGAIDTLEKLIQSQSGEIERNIKDLNSDVEALEQIKKKDETQNGIIEIKKGEVLEKMLTLKSKLDENLFHIRHAVSQSESMLNSAINDVNDAVSEAREKSNEAITDAFNDITKEIRILFCRYKIADISAFRALVDDQLLAVQKIIEMDEVTGLKGMLNKLKEKYVKKIETNKFAAKSKFEDATENINNAFKFLFGSLERQTDFASDYGKVQPSQHALSNLLEMLKKSRHFDNHFTTHLERLNYALHDFVPRRFAMPCSILLDALRRGMSDFAQQLSHAYVNAYSGKIPTDSWVEDDTKSTKKPADKVLSTEGRNCAKVCLTILETLNGNMKTLRKRCYPNTTGEWHNKQINTHGKNPLGTFFEKCGYKVSKDTKGHEGHLLNKSKCNGKFIHGLLCGGIITKNVFVFNTNNDFEGSPIRKLHTHLGTYYRVSHHYIPPKPRAPSSIYQMLQWLLGLYFNPMYQKLEGHISQLFTGLKDEYKLNSDAFDIIVPDDIKKVITSRLDAKQLINSLKNVCLYSEDALIGILGRGHAEGRYACEFYVNTDNLLYPGSPAACFDMLSDILNRVYEQLCFVYKQCHNDYLSSGWRDCHYGRYIGGSSWSCNKFQCPNQDCDQKHNQTCGQKPDQHYGCGIKSPLQSFLEDGLPGFLPHSFKAPGCKLECTLPNHRGIPCKTPMGFGDIGVTASHTKIGKDLKDALLVFCGHEKSHLNKLCSYLQCLLRRPPQTLGDMFAFYHRFLEHWGSKDAMYKKTAFDESVRGANFGDPQTTLNVACIQQYSAHSGKTHEQGDLLGLLRCNQNKSPVVPCGAYLQPLTLGIHDIFSEHNASRYLSWIVYITETFYDLLKKLYDDCCNNCKKPSSRCYDKCCSKDCNVKYTDDSGNPKNPSTNDKHTADCYSIVKCRNAHPTLYAYGFTFGSPNDLSGSYGPQTRRTCKDFCTALQKVIAGESVLIQLIKEIEDFIWKIRQNFSITLLALWSLSLLYLLHITVVRLDLLRIRSHLKSPSSHRIAAQSLLAAARVKALGKITYLQA